jgi:hypothetical protein
LRSGRHHGARDGETTDLRELHPAHPGLRLVVDAESLADVGKVHPDRGGLDEQLPRPGCGIGKIKVFKYFRSTEAFVSECLHRSARPMVR